MHLPIRPRRLRNSAIMRSMVAETHLNKEMFVMPYFVEKGLQGKTEIEAMPGIFRYGLDALTAEIEAGLKIGINKILLFGVGDDKDANATMAYDIKALIPTAIRRLKAEFGHDIFIISDVCVCAYTDHGHCGILDGHHVHNDASLEVLAEMALAHAQAGADMVAPSDMMDGRIAAIRGHLDENDMERTPIMSYSTKFASAYYGPFREAADSAPQKGDRSSYQLSFTNAREALKESLLDAEEGADILMVKPAVAYLDVIKEIKENTLLPLACYNVSGEYAMVKAAAKAGLIDEQKLVMENMMAFKRAGADIIISYHTRDILQQNCL